MKTGKRRPASPPVLRLRRRPVPWMRQHPTWREANPGLIADALMHAVAQPSGNWYVVGASRDLARQRPLGRTVAGHELVAWRTASGRVAAGPGHCPHLGAPLKNGIVHQGSLICHWHGLCLDGASYAGWSPLPAHDDGVLVWVRLDDRGEDKPTQAPAIPPRPDLSTAVTAVYTGFGTCDPEDVVANRLDPWHGAWFHPYSFVDLTVVEAPGKGATTPQDGFTVDVSFKVCRRFVVPVRAVFTAPEPRTVVMRITHGEGTGTVVETHATPLGPDDAGRPHTMVTEAIMAVSARPGFNLAAHAAPALRPLLRAAAGRLWRDDLAYAERRWALRSAGRFHGW